MIIAFHCAGVSRVCVEYDRSLLSANFVGSSSVGILPLSGSVFFVPAAPSFQDSNWIEMIYDTVELTFGTSDTGESHPASHV